MKLSIITINLNNAAGLDKTIASVQSQNFKNKEHIVIDGGSTDNSTAIIEKYKLNLSKWISEKDSGIYNAMNKGIRLAEGEYLLFLNSGDTLYSENTLSEISWDGTDIIYGNMMIHENDTSRIGLMPKFLSRKHMVRDTLWHPVSFIKKEIFNRLGFYDETLKIVGDYDFFLKCIIKNKVSYFHCGKVIAAFNTEGMSSDPANREKLLKERYQVQLRYFTPREIEKHLHISIFEKIKNKINSKLK